jgi:uncharacterized lipoprotein YmbA
MLRANADFSNADSSLLIGMAAVDVPAYLKRSELVVQVGPQELRPARYHRWAEPLDQGVRRYLRDRLSTALGTNIEMNARLRRLWDMQIDVAIEELHGTLDGRALLSASYTIVRLAEPEQIKRGRVRVNESQSRDGYAGLVDVQSRLLDELARRIATDVSALDETGK